MSVFDGVRELARAAARHRARTAAAGVAAATVLAAIVWLFTRGPGAPADLGQRFRDAGRAYAEGRFREAAQDYEDLTRRGYAAPELFFNLGNAYLKEGRTGPAVLNYRKAWRLAPRDPDVSANLRLALQASGAAEADLSSAEIVFTWLSEREWAWIAAFAWWTACLSIPAGLMSGRRWLAPSVAGAAVVVGLLALWGVGTWRGFETEPELVVLRDTVNALTAPLGSAPPRFSLPEGSVVRARGYQGEWVSVSHGELSGWVRRVDCAPVLLAAFEGQGRG